MGKKRFFGQSTAFDVILGVMLGSVLSRAINGNSKVGPSFVAGLTLVLAHFAISWLAYHWDWLGRLVKGGSNKLIENGQVDEKELGKHHLTDDDLLGALRLSGKVNDPQKVELATLERSGHVSVIPKESVAKVMEVKVEQGVQTIRIELVQ